MSNFLKLKQQLNDPQRRAVETIEGPVMVLAGPGTGKTQVVAMRIAEILTKTQLDPRNILALTFTEAGVTALKRRLEQIIGVEAYAVGIHTFHGFAGEVIASFPHVFKQTRDLIQLTEADRFTLIEEILNEHPNWTLLRPLRSPTAHLGAIARRLGECKREAVEPDEMRTWAKQQLVAAKEVKNKVKRDSMESQANRLIEFAQFFERYRQVCAERGRFDYDDTILFVLDALESNAEVKAFYQEKYQYLLVDEYQDTNTAQNRLVELLADFFENPNLFVVGDDKQAIYRFQGATVANMLYFAKKYPSLTTIELETNYRSTPEIVAAAGALADHRRVKLSSLLPELSEKLVAQQPSGPLPTLVSTASRPLEWQWLVERLQQANKRGVAWHEMAVLFRSNALLDEFSAYAARAELPLAIHSSRDAVREPVTSVLVHALRAAHDPFNNQSTYLTATVALPAKAQLKLVKLWHGCIANRTALIEALQADPDLSFLATLIWEWHKNLPTKRLNDTLLTIIDGLRLAASASVDQLELLRILLKTASGIDQLSDQPLKDFILSLSTMREHRLSLAVDTITPEASGIFVSTLHGSKGLEFELVILADIDDHTIQARPDRNIIPLPSAVAGLDGWEDDKDDDERRLFYVGMTRAKKELVLTYARTGGDGREQLPCQYAVECGQTLQVITPDVTDKKITQTLETTLKLPTASVSDQQLAYYREQISSTPLSASSLQAYQTCPSQFLLSRILRLPMPESPAQAYGTAVHAALEEFGRLWRGIRHLPPKSELEKFYTQAASRFVVANEREAAIAKGVDILSAFYDEVLTHSPVPEAVEYNFSAHNAHLNNIALTGKIDRIEAISVKDRTVRIIDFKTGSAKTRNEILGATKKSEGEIKQQLVFYALLGEVDRQFPYVIKEYVVQFVDDKKTFRREVFTISKEEVAELKKTITALHAEMLARTEFLHTRPEYDHGCEICEIFS